MEPTDALASLLAAAGLPAGQIPPGLEARMALWRDRLAGQQLLLILDDAASSDQVRPLLPGSGGSLVLVTSRRHLSALEDATAVSLDTLPPGEAAGLLVRLAGRVGLSADDPAVAEITRLCGFLPLAIGMVARQLHHHPAWSARLRPPTSPPNSKLLMTYGRPRQDRNVRRPPVSDPAYPSPDAAQRPDGWNNTGHYQPGRSG